VHVGVADRDLAVEVAQRVAKDLPVLVALTASSPFWNGQDTGYASIRTLIWQRWPSAGATGPLRSAAEYDGLVDDLIRSGVIADARMAYFDVRPSSHAPTLELRVCDACPVVDDVVLVAGLFRAMVRAAERDVEAGLPYAPPPVPLHRAAIWQAARGGLSGRLLETGDHPRPAPAPQVVRGLLERLRPELEELGDWQAVADLAETTLARGNSADRQRAAFAENGRLEDVMRLVVEETEDDGRGRAPAHPPLRRYRARAGDEAVGLGGVPRRAYVDVVEAVRRWDGAELRRREALRDAWVAGRGLTFGVEGEQRPFAVDLFPRVVTAHEWEVLRAGLVQRARAVECFLRDVYGERRIVRDGVVDASVVGGPGWRPEAERLPPDAVRATVMGFDVVRNEYGGWRVLEDNVRAPSGVAYALAARDLVDAVMPDLPRPTGLADARGVVLELRRALLAAAPPGTVPALLSSGPGSAAWYEHRTLAALAEMPLVGVDDLDVAAGRVTLREDGRRVGALYLRLDGELVDLRDAAGRAVGEAVLDVAAAGGVALANAPGNGVADDKGMYRAVPELIGYYLDERPLLESVPTYRTGDEVERRIVLERVGELVTKPVDGQGGAGVLVGPAASAAEVARRRWEIARRPSDWVAQEVVQLSSLPTVHDGALHPGHVDLRAFVYVTGTGPQGCRLADVALTRVAPRDSLVVNSSRGGSAKDTWVVTRREVALTDQEVARQEEAREDEARKDEARREEEVARVRAGR
jgi:glutamate---cysteine ligase / carboxylate-amine ligase